MKARRLGLSTALLACRTLDSTSHENCDSIIISRDARQNEQFLATVKMFVRQLPAERRPRVSYETKTHLYFYDLNSSIFCLAPVFGVGAGLSPYNVHISEYSYHREDIAENERESLFEAVPPEGNVDIEFTPLGYGNVAAKFYRDAAAKLTETRQQLRAELGREPSTDELHRAGAIWKPWRWSWAWKHDRQWAQWKLADMGARRFAQQHGCRFLQSGESAIPEALLQTRWHFEAPLAEAEYTYGVDPAEGVGGDNTAICILRREGHTVVEAHAEAGQWAPRETARRLKLLCNEFDPRGENIQGYIERNNHGHAVIEKALDFEVPGLLPDPKDHRMGFNKTGPSKVSSQTMFLQGLTDGTLRLSDRALIEEMRTLVHTPRETLEADTGYNDDRFTAACLAMAAMMRPRVHLSVA